MLIRTYLVFANVKLALCLLFFFFFLHHIKEDDRGGFYNTRAHFVNDLGGEPDFPKKT